MRLLKTFGNEWKSSTLVGRMGIILTISGIITLVGALLNVFFGEESVSRLANSLRTPVSYVGAWEWTDEDEVLGASMSVSIPFETSSQIKFRIVGGNAGHTCEMQGIASREGGTHFFEDDLGCQLTFDLDKLSDVLTLDPNPRCSVVYCGAQAELKTEYSRVIGHFQKIGVFSEVQDLLFRELVLDLNYENFAFRMTSMKPVVHINNFQVHSGYVGGLRSEMSAIILVDGNANFHAATRDGKVIRYWKSLQFLNDPMPIPVKDWIEEFKYDEIREY